MTHIGKVLAGAAALPLLLAPALAQEAAAPEAAAGYLEAEDDALVVEGLGLTVGEIEDLDVYGEGGEQIGEVEEVLVDATGEPVALAVETDGFAIMSGEDVVVGLDQLEFSEDRFVTALTEEEFENLPEWDD